MICIYAKCGKRIKLNRTLLVNFKRKFFVKLNKVNDIFEKELMQQNIKFFYDYAVNTLLLLYGHKIWLKYRGFNTNNFRLTSVF